MKGDQGTTSTAGDDTFKATVATLNALDVINGGDGVDTLSLADTGAVASLGGATISNVEKLVVSAGGAVGAIKAVAGTNTAAVAQVATVTVSGSYVTGDTVKVTVGGVEYSKSVTVASGDGKAEAIQAIKDLIDAVAKDSVTYGSTNSNSSQSSVSGYVLQNSFTVTSNTAGTPLNISVGKGTVADTAAKIGLAGGTVSAATATSAVATVTDNVTGTGPVAVAEVKQVTVAGAISGTYTGVSVSIDGTTYTGAATGNTATTLASDAARLINSVLGDSVASASSGVTLLQQLRFRLTMLQSSGSLTAATPT